MGKYNNKKVVKTVSVEEIVKVLSENEGVLRQVLANPAVNKAVVKVMKESSKKPWYEIVLQFLPIIWSIVSKFLLKSYTKVFKRK